MFKPLKTLPLALLAIGGTAEALTLGQIHVQSFINEPLKAVIDVNKATRDEIEALKIKLADRTAFSKVGVDYTRDVQSLRFAVVETSTGTRIEVTSRESISEPFLSFVIDADWNKGSVSKDYTVLLDPPIYTDRFAAPIAPADAGIVRSDEIPEPVAETRPAPAPSEPAPSAKETPPPAPETETAVASGDMKNVGPTAAGSNLWTIARDNKSDAATIQQAMVAIHEANPDAFMRGNMNLMKQGQVLRIPPPDVIEAISQAAAETRISKHQQAWRSGEAVASGERLTPEVVATTGTGSETAAAGEKSSAGAGSSAPQEGRLKLASAGSSASDASDGSTGDADQGSAESMRGELIKMREEMLSAQEENSELRERNSMLEEQLESQKKLIQLQNEQLARLQDYYRRLNEQGGDSAGLVKPDLTPATEETAEEATAGQAETDVATETAEQGQPASQAPDETVATDAAATETDKPASEEAPAVEPAGEADTAASAAQEEPQQAPAESSMLASLMKNNTVVYGATATGIGIIGLLVLWLMRRRKTGEEPEEDILAAELSATGAPEADKPMQPLAAIDVLDKVDPLVARDEIGEARQLLENAILEEPKRYELHLKMLDLMHITGDLEGFGEYRAMLEAANFPADNPEAWARVTEQYEELLATSGTTPEGGSATSAGTAAAAGSAAVAAAALDQFAEIDEDEDDLMPGVEDEEALEAIQRLNTSLDEIPLEDLDSTPESAEEESADEDEESATAKEHTLTDDLGEQDDLESALKLFEMELEDRHPDATGISDETRAELAETAELLETTALGTEEEQQEEMEAEVTEEDDLDIDFSSVSEAFETAGEEPFETTDMEAGETDESGAPVSEEEVQAKVELAEAFAEMGDVEGAREILNEVMREGSERQRMTAEEILQKYAS